MSEYEFECCVTGVYSGSVKARNKKEAKELAISEMALNDLEPDGEIHLQKIEEVSV